MLVLRSLSFVVADAEGVSEGFDLDGQVSTEGGPTGCGIADYTTAGGAEGIDNAFSRIVPTLDATEARLSTIEALVQDSIDSGELLLTVELGSLDDWQSDDCVAVDVGQAEGEVLLGTDGRLLDGQTFDREAGAPTVSLVDGHTRDGELLASGLSIDLPVQILDVSLSLPLRDGRVALWPVDEHHAGLIGGSISADYILEVASGGGIDPVVGELLSTVMSLHADLPGGSCDAMSVTLGFEAVGAYFFD